MQSSNEFKDVEVFSYSDKDFNVTTRHWDDKDYDLSQFDQLLRNKWDEAMKDGHFRYHLDKVETKIIPGEKKYVAQLNVKRATERRKPQEILRVNQPFNPDLFNFSRIKSGEVLFLLSNTQKHNTDKQQKTQLNGYTERKPENLVIINISPLEYGHVLIVPDVYAFQPQMLTEYAIRLSIESILLSRHQGFRMGFNSLCAYASVNHQHLHAYYLEKELYVESCPVKQLKGILYEIEVMPVKGFVFQLHGSTIEEVSRVVHLVMEYLQKSEVAHNLFMTRGTVFGEDRTSRNRTVRLFLWPRKKFIGIKEEAAFNVAVIELAGHLPIKIAELYDGLTEESIEATIKEASLEEEEYQKLKDKILDIYEPSVGDS